MKVAPPPADPLLARFAQHQWGLVTRAQLQQLGLSDKGIAARVRTLRLHRIHRGVYAVGHRVLRQEAAVLACGGGAVLSHASAAVLWELRAVIPAIVDVTVPSRSGRAKRRGIRLHRSAHLDRTEIVVRDGIPVTTVARTLLDLADVLDDAALTRAVNEARLNHRLDLDRLADLLTRSPGRATTRLRPFVDRPTAPTRSAFEDAFLAMLDRYGLPRPEINQRIAGHEVDAVWREQHLVVELDGREYHGDDASFETDRDRDAGLLAAGFPVVRVTWARLTQRPGREARRLERLLRSPAGSGAGARSRPAP
jgi:very-short-patch-repair endonuclease/predicted transcriptional regulator of viral defense system